MTANEDAAALDLDAIEATIERNGFYILTRERFVELRSRASIGPDSEQQT
jgi:hypothetical protein